MKQLTESSEPEGIRGDLRCVGRCRRRFMCTKTGFGGEIKPPKRLSLVYYLHTIDGKPAFFSGDQICYASGKQNRQPQRLARTRAQIKREQDKTVEFRRGFLRQFDEAAERRRYDYVRVWLP